MARFKIEDLMPRTAFQQDLTGDLQNFIDALQAVWDDIMAEVDVWTDIFDIDRAPDKSALGLTNFIDVILWDLGNPFAFIIGSDTNRKRRVARSLVLMYRQKGTCIGIVNAVRTLMGLESQCLVVSETFPAWQLDVSLLGINTFLYGDERDLWGFELHVNGTMTATDRDNITAIVNYMKPKKARLTQLIQGSVKDSTIRFDTEEP